MIQYRNINLIVTLYQQSLTHNINSMKKYIIWSIVLLSITSFAQNRQLQAETNHSTIGFDISIAGFSKVSGKFTDFEILVDWNDTDLKLTKISSVIKAASINTGILARDEHLISADFFNVTEYPTITFESDTIIKIDFSHFKVNGKLTMHGVTKEIELPLQIIKQDGNTIGFKSITSLNRLDFGVGSEFKHTSMPEFLSNMIEVEIYFWTKKRKDSIKN